MQMTKSGAEFEFDCARGAITEPLSPDSQGHFSLKGTLTPEHGGPIRKDEAAQSMDVTYTGDLNDDTMTLQLIVADKELAHYTLKRRQHGNLRKCR